MKLIYEIRHDMLAGVSANKIDRQTDIYYNK